MRLWLAHDAGDASGVDLPLPKTPKGTILASQQPGIRGTSVLLVWESVFNFRI